MLRFAKMLNKAINVMNHCGLSHMCIRCLVRCGLLQLCIRCLVRCGLSQLCIRCLVRCGLSQLCIRCLVSLLWVTDFLRSLFLVQHAKEANIQYENQPGDVTKALSKQIT